jgi:hypothetical protein
MKNTLDARAPFVSTILLAVAVLRRNRGLVAEVCGALDAAGWKAIDAGSGADSKMMG